MTPVLLSILGIQAALLISTGNVVAYNDGISGLSSQSISKGPDAPDAEKYMRNHYDSGLVFMDDYRRPIGIVASGIPIKNFIGTGNKPYWRESLDNPGKYAKWIVVQKSSTDAVWTQMQHKEILSDHFVNVFSRGNIYIYERKVPDNNFVTKDGQHLFLKKAPYSLKGVNSYDLMTQSKTEIDLRLQNISKSGFNTVRFWCFEKDGSLKAKDLSSLDYIFSQGDKYGIKFICVFGNTLSDYGGWSNFGATSSRQFFTDATVIKAYTSQIRNSLIHENPVNNQMLRDNSAIAAWEIINEPRLEGEANSDLISSWVTTVGQAILASDPNHLISPGTEGFTYGYKGAYYDEAHGSSITSICNLEVVTLCSAHLYPKYMNNQVDSTSLNALLNRWRHIADIYSKPMYIGEIGYDLSAKNSTNKDQIEFYRQANLAIKHNALDGGLLWNLGSKADKTFTLQYGDSNSEQIFANWK